MTGHGQRTAFATIVVLGEAPMILHPSTSPESPNNEETDQIDLLKTLTDFERKKKFFLTF